SRFFRASVHSEGAATFFASVQRLDPAHNLIVSRTGTRTYRYWDYPTELLDMSPEDASLAVRDLLSDSVRLRMRSDVPVGTSLSGGLDSATVVSLVRALTSDPHQTFTASFPGEIFDEAPRATELATSLGMEPHRIAIKPDELLPLLHQIVYHLDAPTQCPAVIPLWNIMREMKGKVVVALDGQGADELFGGYIDRVFGHAFWASMRKRHVLDASRDLRRHVRTWGWWTAVSWSVRDIAPSTHRWYRRLRQDESVYSGALKGGPDDVPVRIRNPDSPDAVNRVLREQHE